MDIQKRIAQFINDNGVKQSFLSEKTGLSRNIISGIMTSQRKMSADEYFMICQALNKEPNYFMLEE